MRTEAITAFDVHTVRKDFPILGQQVNGYPLVYFDNAATSQKPQVVIDALVDYYQGYNSNIHRGLHYLSEKATAAYESAREKAAQFINAGSVREINFVRGTTEGINLIAQGYGRKFLKTGDEIIISTLEHHSNIVPWQMLCEQTGALLKVMPINERGEIIFEEFEKLLTERTKIVSLVYVSNALGTINPAQTIITRAHAAGAVVVLDAAQAAPHIALDVQALDCDFLCFSSHKMFGPTGIGVMYGKERLLEAMDPYQGGGEMIKEVSFAKTTYNDLPYKFEAGTPNIADGIAFGAAIDYLRGIGLENVATYEHQLLEYGTQQLSGIEGLRIIGTAKEKASVISFLVEGIHPYDMGVLLDKQGIAIRTGHHCCQPLMGQLNITGTCRASFAFYNTFEEIDRLKQGIERAKKMLL
ncbi:MAG: cysteine desulfurase [Chitinophagales bacterium]|nr:cysteine desulfurase [Chitinophagales bacterium]